VEGQSLAVLLGRRVNLKLVFLNGCSTRPQVQSLLDAGVPVVIATARPIKDKLARQFAVAFYEALTAGGEAAPAGGRSLRAAFEAAQAYVLGQPRIDGRARDLIDADTPQSAQDITNGWGMPWDLFIRPGAGQVERWDLFADEPLFGLPDLPADIGLPDEPFRNLDRFGREHARIFCGRGRAIRELHDLVTRPATPGAASVLLYYGQTGVGKTSVLAAGLLPRLEQTHSVRYLRRSASHGLLGELRQELDPGAESFDLHRAWLARESHKGLPLVVVLDQAEEAYTRPPAGTPDEDGAVVLKHPLVDPQAEVCALVEAVRSAFDPARPDRPRGKLILAFRKEWLDEFEKACKAANLAFESIPLSPLDRDGILEAVRSPVSEPNLARKRDKYRLTIKPEEPPLPELIADDLLNTLADPKKNQVSPIAPTLQILLTRMWAAARERDHDSPTFDRSLYTDLKTKGYQLGEVLDQQLRMIAAEGTTAIEEQEGLLLDMLEWFTTPLGTAATHTKRDLFARYPSQEPRRLEALVESCQGRYLLAGISDSSLGGPAYRLTHDTLAPLVRERFRLSGYPAQRARRLLENRAADWKGRDTDPVLDSFDLSIVEAGLRWMRGLIKHAQIDELGLIEASRQAERIRKAEEAERQRQLRESRERELENERRARRREKEQGLAREEEQRQAATQLRWRFRFAVGFAIVAAIATVVAVVAERTATEKEKTAKCNEKRAIDAEGKTKDALQREKTERHKAETSARRAEAQRLAAQAELALSESPQLAILVAAHAIRVHRDRGELRTPAAEQALRRVLAQVGGRPLYGHREEVKSVALSGDGRRLVTGSRDKTVRVWEIASHPTAPRWILRADSFADAVAISPDGRWVAVVGQTSVSNESGKKEPKDVYLWDLNAANPGPARRTLTGHSDTIWRLAFTPDSKRLVSAGADETARLWDLTSTNPNVGPRILNGHRDTIYTLDVSPDGRWLLTGDNGSIALLWDLLNPKAHPLRLQLARGARAVAFFKDSRQVATGDWSGEVIIWNLKGESTRRFEWKESKGAGPLAFADDAVEQLAVSPNGKWLACGTYKGPVCLWDLSQSTNTPRVLRDHRGSVKNLAISPNGRWLATAGFFDKTVRLWDLHTSDPHQSTRALHGHEAEITSLAFSPDSNRLVTGSEDKSARLWNLNESRRVVSPLVMKGDRTAENSFALAPDGRRFALLGEDKFLRIWSLDRAGPSDKSISLGECERRMQALRWSPDSRKLVASFDEGSIKVWDAREGGKAPAAVELPGHDSTVGSLLFSPDARWLATGSGGTVHLWDLSLADPTSKVQSVKVVGAFGQYVKMGMSPSGRWLATLGDVEGSVRLFDLAAADPVSSSTVLPGHGKDPPSILFDPNNRLLLTSSPGRALLWGLSSGTPKTPRALKSPPSELGNTWAFSLDGRLLAGAALREQKPIRLFTLGQDQIPSTDLAVADPFFLPQQLSFGRRPDELFAVTPDGGRVLRLNSSGGLEKVIALRGGHRGGIHADALRRDGRQMATTGGDSTVRLWNLTAPDPESDSMLFKGSGDAQPRGAAFTDDLRWLVVWFRDGSVYFWHTELENLLNLAGETVGRNMDVGDWFQYFPGQPYAQTFPGLPVPGQRTEE
jgi:WD40 repeat protein